MSGVGAVTFALRAPFLDTSGIDLPQNRTRYF